MSIKSEAFLSKREEEEVVEAIRQAERKTSGEIRVHLEPSTGDQDIFERAMEVFHALKMDNTKESNGVLIYVAVEDRNFVIYGDKGINDVVPDDFWESTKELIVGHFKNGKFKDGLVDGVLKAGEQLQKHFPWDENNTNELSDQISKA
ncbi:TLP18.3/Psb32/MOLO-1 phosphatase superfamily protein [Christiangramia gaetbulicola]|uniref:TLP18.3/Psb32/MOLO-1 phosphatase superfamily protein n=1 Tax=Christiangramia gaetbulicola TaxID=703340 RepID=A0A2T6AKP7_9FLAO|nr:TPM domain-containing protein [Christiangramia gaetbulicola]PTX44401.1 TLP18.3/Psb32/MOLO-1 phosphatase superfamily protein [Christiangramia gaetbulicola]